ncbi:FAD-dependent oxidoreductase [Actinoallomurus iriomotensis]|uniref:Pyridine nucleotide-disulfide oxidoreductase n=1 Tax=Actinoallomurus iriomotensis TaxID=478107 RepID=A0A9W6S233_9ACTN|nr:FAD-dependent oxidoreductase [Actinoallomurus iriomotensis]GLY85818.1 pyridine nucleotide-disulfide oxidoreductase [Actinoallomurus iriomotensis]
MTRHVVVIGAGPAGLGATTAAVRAGARVTLLDSADQAGGQYHRMPPDAYEARRPFRVCESERCDWWPGAAVWALERRDSGPPRVHVVRGPDADGDGRRRCVLRADALVLAPGAHDRVLPFPGWELPGVVTAGAAQVLAKGERVAVGGRVLVAGTGPFLLPVAASLLDVGAHVLGVLEAGTAGALLRGWARRPWELAGQAGRGAELGAYAARLARGRVPYRTGRGVVEARGDGRVEEVVTARLRADWSVVPGSEQVLTVDALCVTHGFTPRLELPVAAGCALLDGFVAVDGDQATSAPGVYAAGEVTGIAGAPAARDEGVVAGWMAGGGTPGRLGATRRRRDEGRAFASRLAAAHPIGRRWADWLRPDTIVCRCEETDYGTLRDAAASRLDARAVRLGTRAGLGPCQARICGPTLAELLDTNPHHRPIAWPIRLGELANPPAEPKEGT